MSPKGDSLSKEILKKNNKKKLTPKSDCQLKNKETNDQMMTLVKPTEGGGKPEGETVV